MVIQSRIQVVEEQKLALSVGDTAAALGVSTGSVYDAIAQKRLPAVRIGRRVLVPKVALDSWLKRAGEETCF